MLDEGAGSWRADRYEVMLRRLLVGEGTFVSNSVSLLDRKAFEGA